MKYFKTYSWRPLAFVGLLFFAACNKDVPTPNSPALDLADNRLVREWLDLSVTLSQQCNGYSEPIIARSFRYLTFALYESLVPAVPGIQSLQVNLDGFKVVLPQADPALVYHWGLVANEVMSQLNKRFFESAGDYWVQQILGLQNKHRLEFSANLDQDVLLRSESLGKSIAKAIWDFSLTDGKGYSFLDNYPRGYVYPTGPGKWIPTSPDYRPNPLLPHWGETQAVLNVNVLGVQPPKVLKYADSPNSIIYSEALEVYNLSKAIVPEQKEDFNYFNKEMHANAVPVSHVFRLALQISKEQQLDLSSTIRMLCSLSFGIHDGLVAAWKQKYTHHLCRVSSYIKQEIDRFYVPQMGSEPTPDFVSEEAIVYSIGAEILSAYFGYRFPFMDHTQSERNDLRAKSREFTSFREFAREAAFIDMHLGVHYRSSIEAGLEMGYDIAQNILRIDFHKK
ncbi:MAG: vanadium-dependent haloperoxidase [Saprospiraceae bacterium]|nr:vanadium-dependent haloperoxidase [Saprospiraceae bacterium]